MTLRRSLGRRCAVFLAAAICALALVEPARCDDSVYWDGFEGFIDCRQDGLCPDRFLCSTPTNHCVLITSRGDEPIGATCASGSDCLSGSCADGVCCNNLCDGQCESCAAANPGTCTATTGPPVGRDSCSGGGVGICAATCGGENRASCVFPTIECGPASCQNATQYAPAMCSNGTCQSPAVQLDCTTTLDSKRCGATQCAGVVEVTAANARTYVTMSDGSVLGWGLNYKGVLGPGAPLDEIVRTPTRFPDLTGVQKLTSSPYLWHQCALMNDSRLLCWGDNRYAQLGIGTTDDVAHPVPLPPLWPDGATPLTNVVDVGVGTYHTCAILSNHTVYCWGRGIHGRLADGDVSDHLALYAKGPILPAGTTGETIAIGEDHACIGIEPDSSSPVRCWGTNSSGESGVTPSSNTGGLVVQSQMNVLDNTNRFALALGNSVTCAIVTGGLLDCFGNNQGYQLGRGADNQVFYTNVPAPVCATATSNCTANGSVGVPLANVAGVALGEAHACALAGGEIRCWGDCGYGQCGNGSNDYAPYAGSGPTFTQGALQITAGQYHSCALLADRTVACWGRNTYGDLGIPDTSDYFNVPVVPIW